MTQRTAKHLRSAALALGVTVLLAGCAGPNPRDPYEGFNRAMFSFNDTVDTYALKPAATAYRNVLPNFVQTGVNNFFGNLADAWTGVNNLLQGHGEAGMSDVTRFALNSTLGIVGLFDIASEAGLQKHKEDFGQTLGTWGVPSGPYLMLPLLGPSTVRDTVALPLDIKGDIWGYKEPVYIRNTGTALRVVDQRANLLNATSLLEDAALDRYEFIRDGFLQRRESQIHPDGDDAPRKPSKDDSAEPEGKPEAKPEAKPVAAAQSSTPVSSESAPKELNSGAPAAATVSQ
ncbi:MlaA family lipoprotein [Duganella vulcania]|uniref:VacJ family lipoprotein n=1 Tax=Duganella vulcania TaxID=2692166 RepID=A0A845GM94_9BURK|nr:VacJ family lipoprotein [Duganella vulcania]MYM93837.1 VacJ family lipoprotein [Duganella vulcania]